MLLRSYLFVVAIALILATNCHAFSATENNASASQASPGFSIHAKLAKSYQISTPALAEGEPVTILVTFQNISDHKQTVAPCGRYGVWSTDNKRFYVEPDSACKIENTITLASHNSFPGVLTLNLRAIGWNTPEANTNIQPPKSIKIGLLPPSVGMCDAIIHGSHGQCGDADTSWSNPILLSP